MFFVFLLFLFSFTFLFLKSFERTLIGLFLVMVSISMFFFQLHNSVIIFVLSLLYSIAISFICYNKINNFEKPKINFQKSIIMIFIIGIPISGMIYFILDISNLLKNYTDNYINYGLGNNISNFAFLFMFFILILLSIFLVYDTKRNVLKISNLFNKKDKT